MPGTTDIDVQVDREIAAGAVNTKRLETALQNAEFDPDNERIWRWKADGAAAGAIVKFELLGPRFTMSLDRTPAATPERERSSRQRCGRPLSCREGFGPRKDLRSS